METHKRSIVKSVSWRFFAMIITSVAAWFITGSVETGLCIGFVDMLAKLFSYYAHERLWQRVKWGFVRSDVVVGCGGGI